MITCEELFDPDSGFAHQDILKGTEYPWQPVGRISEYIADWIEREKQETATDAVAPWGRIQECVSRKYGKEVIVYVHQLIRLEEDFCLKNLGIFIGAGTRLEPSALIRPNVIIGRDCDIRQGAYVRGNVITGDHVVIGHTTEVKNSLIMNHSEAGHFSYIGDSLIGNYVNLGAGVKLANLQFRTIKEKQTGDIRPIKLLNGKEVLHTGCSKIGAVLGDGCELGCNSVTSPCVILGKKSKVYPAVTVSKGIYPAGAVIQ